MRKSVKIKKFVENYQIHAYLDGQLSREESLEIESAMQSDASLRDEVSQISALKAQLKSSYAQVPVPPRKVQASNGVKAWRMPKSAVASLLFGVLLGAGILNVTSSGSGSGLGNDLSAKNGGLQQSAEQKYIVHLDSREPEKLEQALQKVESLLASGDPLMQVNLISNSEGVHAFDVNNPKRHELEALLSRYDNLTLLACKHALKRVAERGETLELLPQVKFEQPAIDLVVERLTTGWKYIKI